MTVRDWRTIAATEMARLYATETARWIRDLAWDPAPALVAVEVARTTWGLPGLVSVDVRGRVRGWTFYLPVQDRLDVGGFVSDSPDTTTALVDAVIERAGSSQRLGGLVYATAPGLASTLASRHVPCERYSYRLRRLDETSGSAVTCGTRPLVRPPDVLRHWSESDIDATSELLYESYERNAGPIGPGATLDDWHGYVTNLVRHAGCGTLLPALSRVLTVDGVVTAAALVSTIAAPTAHLVQLAVHRAHQGTGLGRMLLAAAVDASQSAGFSAMSLLVAENNEAALRLYQEAGFMEQATFISFSSAEISGDQGDENGLRPNSELRTPNSERRTPNPELRTGNAEPEA